MIKNTNLIIKETFALALKNHQNGNLKAAKNLYDKILKIDPKHISALNNLGLVFQTLMQHQKAINSFEKAIEINPNNILTLNNLGNVLGSLGINQKAINSFEKAIEINPNYVDAHNNLGIVFKNIGENQKAINSFEKAIEINPNYVDAHYNLGVAFKELEKLKKAINSFEKAIEINPNYVDAYNNLGVVFHSLGDSQKAKSFYEKTIGIDLNHKDAHNNLGLVFQGLGEPQKALSYYKKAIEIDSNFQDAHFNLGVLLYEIGQYKNAIEEFKLINFKKSKSRLLTCLYKLDFQSLFFKELDNLINQGEVNAMIGSLISRSEIRYSVKKPNPFCKEPLKYFLKTNLIEKYDFKNIFIKIAKNILNDNLISNKVQNLLTNGFQTTGNLFSQKNNSIEEIKYIIYSEIEKYRTNFKNSEEGLIKRWPINYDIYGWLVSMKSGGKIKPHMHEDGWLSGSIYINIPPKLKTDSGNLVVCIDDKEKTKETKINTQKIIDVVTGSLCLFPASLHHYTIPFESEEERIVLAFDVVAKT